MFDDSVSIFFSFVLFLEVKQKKEKNFVFPLVTCGSQYAKLNLYELSMNVEITKFIKKNGMDKEESKNNKNDDGVFE